MDIASGLIFVTPPKVHDVPWSFLSALVRSLVRVERAFCREQAADKARLQRYLIAEMKCWNVGTSKEDSKQWFEHNCERFSELSIANDVCACEP